MSYNSLAQVSLIYVNLLHVSTMIIRRELSFADTSDHCETVKKQCIPDMAVTSSTSTQHKVQMVKKKILLWMCVSSRMDRETELGSFVYESNTEIPNNLYL